MDANGRVHAGQRQMDSFVLAATNNWVDVADVEAMQPAEDDETFHNRIVAVAGHRDKPAVVGYNGIGHMDQASAAAVAVGEAQHLDKAIHSRNNALQSKGVSMAYLETSCSCQELVREGPYKSQDHRAWEYPSEPCNCEDHSSLSSPAEVCPIEPSVVAVAACRSR